MDDDFSTPEAIATVFDLITEVNSLPSKQFDRDQLKAVLDFFEITVAQIFGLISEATSEDDLKPMVNGTMEILMAIREDARLKRDWHMSDLIRDKLSDIGIELKDTPDGQKWLFK